MAVQPLKAVFEWVLRTMMKDQTGIVQTMPKKDIVEMNTQITAQRLMQNGIDPTQLKNANQVENAINMIEKRPNVQEGITAAKSADVFELQMPPKKINPKKGIMGGKQIPDDDLPPPGSRGGKDDIAAPVQSSEETIKNMIEAENKKNISKIKNRKMVKDAIDNMSIGFVKGDRKYNAQLVAEDLAEKRFGKEFYDLDQRQQMDLYDEALDGLSEDFAQGGRAGFSNGGIDILKLEDEAMQRALNAFKYYQSMGGKKNFRDYIKESGRFGDQFRAEGGRIGYKIGSIDKARRAFLKTVGAAGAGITALKTGLLGLGKEAAPTTEKIIEKVATSDVPPYFLNLVNKIKNLGQKFDGPKERSESFTYKDYEMDIDYDTGAIEIKKTKESMIPGGDEAGISEEVYMTYKPGMADESTKGKKVVDEYEEFTTRPDIDGKMKDVDEGVPDEVIKEGTMFEDNITEFGKASGGIARMLGE